MSKRGFGLWVNVWSGYWSVGKVEHMFSSSNPFCESQMSGLHVIIHMIDATPRYQQ